MHSDEPRALRGSGPDRPNKPPADPSDHRPRTGWRGRSLGAAFLSTALLLPAGYATAAETDYTISVEDGETGPEISDSMYGIFMEDINFAADGGLYPELVQNRSFEFGPEDNEDYDPLTAWEEESVGGASGTAEVVDDDGRLNENNRNYLRLDLDGDGDAADSGFGLVNSGFLTGMAVDEGAEYEVSVWARGEQEDGNDLTLTLRSSEDGAPLADPAVFEVEGDEWTWYSATLTPDSTAEDGELAVTAGGEGSVSLDMVSLFPEDTFNDRPNGLRPDLAEQIAGLDPDFVRFPGGCLVNTGSHEAYEAPDWERERSFQWKETVGPVEERATNRNFWGYNQSYGLGYFEYFQFAEDVDAMPVPVVPAMVTGCGEDEATHDRELLERHIQDTLDLVEFANGPVDSTWGAKRAEMGHPEPFGLTHVQVGNEENLGEEFFEVFLEFREAIEDEYPEITVVGNSGPSSSGENFDRLWELNTEAGVELVDEHYYEDPEWYLENHHRYDDYDRNGPDVFLGEYGSWGNTFHNALVEASYLTGLERNADLVQLVSYAPLLAHDEDWQWDPNLIWFDNTDVWGSANYEVLKLFSTQTGDEVVPSDASQTPGAEVEPFRQVITRDTDTGDLVIKVVNVQDADAGTEIDLGSGAEPEDTGTATTLQGDPEDVNTGSEQPIQPEEAEVEGVDSTFEYTFPGNSVTFLRIPTS